MMQYKGYLSKVEFDDLANVFHGEVVNIRDVITFQGRTVDELHEAFQASVEAWHWVRKRLAPLPPRCREGVDSPHLPTCPFRASGDFARSTPFGELCVLIYAG